MQLLNSKTNKKKRNTKTYNSQKEAWRRESESYIWKANKNDEVEEAQTMEWKWRNHDANTYKIISLIKYIRWYKVFLVSQI